ncbi:hypothetical protein [Streptomyces sp. NPDC048659]|uniref:hypothetical protein n=1 Tax=Streptomyces sp. NPDC048659 TaxID=3155489 RepID=UPI0034466D13
MTSNTSSPSRGRTRGRTLVGSLLVLPVLALAVACGSGGGVKDSGVATVPDEPSATASATSSATGGAPASAGKGAFYDAQMVYVRCMRAKAGVKDFPDPKLSGYLDWTKIDELSAAHPEVSKGGRNGACVNELLAAQQQEPERDAQAEYESMLSHAKCMRDNGVSRFQNPTMSGGNVIPGGDPNPASPSFDRSSPAYKQAVNACKDKLLDGLDGMQ